MSLCARGSPLIDGTYFEVLDNRYNSLKLRCKICTSTREKDTIICANVNSSSNIYSHLRVS